MEEIKELVSNLTSREVKAGCKALKQLQIESKKSSIVYPYMEQFKQMLQSENSYIRTRGLLLIAVNAKWDRENKVNEMMEEYLRHITDEKPITARQCIHALPEILKYKPELKERVRKALYKADISQYADSMQPLVKKDIAAVIKMIEEKI